MVLDKKKIATIREMKKEGAKWREIRKKTKASFSSIKKYGVDDEPTLTTSTASPTLPNKKQTVIQTYTNQNTVIDKPSEVTQSPSTSPTPATTQIKNPELSQKQIDLISHKILTNIEKNHQPSTNNTLDSSYKELEKRLFKLECEKQTREKTKDPQLEKPADEPKLDVIKQQHIQSKSQPTTNPGFQDITNPKQDQTESNFHDKETQYLKIQPYHIQLVLDIGILAWAILKYKKTGVFINPFIKNKTNKIQTVKPFSPLKQIENEKSN